MRPQPEQTSLEKIVTTPRVTYVLRASRLVNLVYQVDCLAQVANCSRDSYAALWQPTADDQRALATWRELRTRYTGTIASAADVDGENPLPLARDLRTIGTRVRMALLDARDLDDLAARLALFFDPGDAIAARRVLDRFAPRADELWRARSRDLARALDAYAVLVGRPDVRATLEQVARFYAPELPPGATETIDLIARSSDDMPDNAEQVRDHALVETRAGHAVTSDYPVIAHEMFHAWFAAGAVSKQRALAAAFVAVDDPLAIAGYALLNEVLSTALGNGAVARLVDPDDFAKRARQASGLYADDYIDGVAKALLPRLDARLAAGKSLYDDDFVPEYLAAVRTAFPHGLPPIVYLRAMTAVFEPSLQDAFDHLAEVARAGMYDATATSDPESAHDTLMRGVHGTRVLLATNPEAIAVYVDKPTIAALRAQARAHRAFAWIKRNPGVLFVLVAADTAAMKQVIAAVAAQKELRDGAITP